MPYRQDSAHAPRLGGRLAVVVFILALVAFVVESQLAQYVQTSLGYRQPFFIFYLVHSSFMLVFPLHLVYLRSTTGYTISSLSKGLSLAITNRLSSSGTSTSSFARLSLLLFLGLTCPALLWFVAVTLASLSDVTAIWNTNAFFAYIFTVKFLNVPWESRRLFAVLLATLGVVVVVYGGGTTTKLSDSKRPSTQAITSIMPSPLLGDILSVVASVAYGLYQVLYKKYAALPSDPELVAEDTYLPVSDDYAGASSHDTSLAESAKEDIVFPPPFGLHPNLLTSFVGLLTFIILWIPLPLLHYYGIEKFRLPGDARTYFAICGIAAGGIVFNAGFMVLLGIWGPITTSVGSLLTNVLVAISDAFFGAGINNLTIWSLVGCSVITAAFAVLAHDMYKKGSEVA